MKQLNNESGITLIEVLAAITITAIISSLIYGVLCQTIHTKDKIQYHNELRQEANIVMTQLRTMHETGHSIWYSSGMLYEDAGMSSPLANEKDFKFVNVEINGTNNTVLVSNGIEFELSPVSTYTVSFIIKDNYQNQYKLETVLPSTTNLASGDGIVKPPSTVNSFYTYLKNNNVFVYGSTFSFNGNQVNGPNATMVVNGSLLENNINGGARINVSNIYFDGSAYLVSGQEFGSSTNPGTVYVDGNLTLGTHQNIYGDVYVNGNLNLVGSEIYGNIYVNGNVELGNTPTLVGDAKIYYTGTLSHPNNYDNQNKILPNVIHQSTVPGLDMLNTSVPNLKDTQWYSSHGYNQTIIPDNMRIYGNNINIQSYYDSTLRQTVDTFTNAIVVSQGDINIDGGSINITGVLFAPNGKVTFKGQSFEGLVIARDGFYVTSGGTTITFKGIDQYIDNEEDFPLQY